MQYKVKMHFKWQKKLYSPGDVFTLPGNPTPLLVSMVKENVQCGFLRPIEDISTKEQMKKEQEAEAEIKLVPVLVPKKQKVVKKSKKKGRGKK